MRGSSCYLSLKHEASGARVMNEMVRWAERSSKPSSTTDSLFLDNMNGEKAKDLESEDLGSNLNSGTSKLHDPEPPFPHL